MPAAAHVAVDWPAGRVLAIAATFNERPNILRLAAGVLAADPAMQLLVVDDASPDGTAAEVETLAAAEPRQHLLVRDGRRGLGNAIMEGLRIARERGFVAAVNLDADACTLVVVAEGAKLPDGGLVQGPADDRERRQVRLGGIGELVAREIAARLDRDVRTVVLGHPQRGGTPTAFDRVLATGFGA
ncbi:MAG: glycosyltransferase [Planctomycetes bacterium]|nr:glycosyltransferase [Planctomycetota bacterium]